jgi:septal ring factor EnvC (AmiA/AmiB activator)
MFGRTKALKWHLSDVTCQLEQSRKEIGLLQKTLLDTECSLADTRKSIQTLTDDLEIFKKENNRLTTLLTNTSNLANARLSALVGMKRYLDTFFEPPKEEKEPETSLE